MKSRQKSPPLTVSMKISSSRANSLIVIGALVAGVLFVSYVAWPTDTSSPEAPAAPSRPAPPELPVATTATTSAATSPASQPAAPVASPEIQTGETPPSGAEPEPTSPQQIALDAIQELAITYDAASIPALAKFLSHADPEIRAAARDGLITLGERAAIPALQSAARTATPEEARALLEAAEFLALPTLTEHRAAQKAAKAGAATP